MQNNGLHITTSFQEFWYNYRENVFFFLILSLLVALGHWLAHFIPTDFIDEVVLPVQHGANIAICTIGAWLLFRHANGLRSRKTAALALVLWGMADSLLLLQDYVLQLPVLRIQSEELNASALLACSFLAWALLTYPTEVLRPGWLNWKTGLLQLLPMVALVILDYFLPIDLRILITLYPAVLIGYLFSHLRRYRLWCEENFSSMNQIDAQWVVRYLSMVLVMGLSYLYILFSNDPSRVVTQNALLFFLYIYSIDQILFRKDPWAEIRSAEAESSAEEAAVEAEDISADREKVEAWMRTEKPYLNPDFQLMDLRAVLPMNRTYLSQFINSTYGCSFYQFVNSYRVEEAKQLMQEHPEMKMADVAVRSGFASQAVFSQVFSKETGISPLKWSKERG